MSQAGGRPPLGPFFEELADPCWVLRVEGLHFVMEAANRAWEAGTGIPVEAVVGLALADWMPPELLATVSERLRACCSSRTSATFEEELAFATGVRFWQTRLTPWPSTGEVTHVLGIARDFTAIARAEQAMTETEQRFRRLAENAQDVVYRYRYLPERGFEYLSPSVERITGFTPEEHYADPGLVPRSLHPDDSEVFEAFDQSPSDDTLTLRWFRRDGSMVWTETRNVRVFDAVGRLVAVEGIARDITERKRREEEQRALEQKLLETQKLESLGVLAGGVAHDFNNLLTGILGRVSLFRSEELEIGVSSAASEHLQQIEQAAIQAADLCRQMLAYSGKGRFAVRPLDLSELVRDTAHLLHVSVSKNATLELDLAQSLPAVAGDAAQLRQVLLNVVLNASEALPEGKGRIVVSTTPRELGAAELGAFLLGNELPSGTYVCLDVWDGGIGMPPAVRERIFEPFYTTKFTGRGLGLPAVLGILRGHRGAIEVQSEPGQGTRFRLYFPVAEGAPPGLSRPVRVSKIWQASGTILVIDDEEIVRNVTSRLLRSFGFTTLLAADGIDGVSQFKQHLPEVTAVLLDLTMPGLDGEAVFRQLRALRTDVPVLLMSGYNEQEAISRFESKGLAGFLQKPFTVEQLAAKLRSILASA
jgi:PAS domain S-box-containing protein